MRLMRMMKKKQNGIFYLNKTYVRKWHFYIDIAKEFWYKWEKKAINQTIYINEVFRSTQESIFPFNFYNRLHNIHII